MENFEKIELRPDFTARIVTPYIGSGEPKIPFIYYGPLTNLNSFDYASIIKDPETGNVMFIVAGDYYGVWDEPWIMPAYTYDHNVLVNFPLLSQYIDRKYVPYVFEAVYQQIIKDGFVPIEEDNWSIAKLNENGLDYADPANNPDKRYGYSIDHNIINPDVYTPQYIDKQKFFLAAYRDDTQFVFKVIRTNISMNTFEPKAYSATIEKPFLFGDIVQHQTLFKDDKVYKYSPIEIPVRLDVNNLLNPPGNYQLNNDNQFIIYEKNDY